MLMLSMPYLLAATVGPHPSFMTIIVQAGSWPTDTALNRLNNLSCHGVFDDSAICMHPDHCDFSSRCSNKHVTLLVVPALADA